MTEALRPAAPVADARAAPLVKSVAESLAVEDPHPGRAPPGPSAPSALLFVAVAVCCISPVLLGFTLCFTSPVQGTMTLPGSEAVPHNLAVMDKAEFSTFASLLNIGAVVGAFAGAVVSDLVGRKKALALTSVPHIVSWVAIFVLAQPMTLTAARLLGGFAIGMGSSITPCYIGEVAPMQMRGALGAANHLCITGGVLLVNVLGMYVTVVHHGGVSYCNWRQLALCGLAMDVALLSILAMPESPKWLAQRGDAAGARAALAHLRAGDCTAEQDALVFATAGKLVSPDSSFGDMGSLWDYKRSLAIAIGIFFFQQMSGVNAFTMYTNAICRQAGVQNDSAATIAVAILQVVFTGISCVIMDRHGRRTLLGMGSLMMCAAHFGLSAYYHVGGALPPWFALLSLGMFIVGFSLAVGPIPWLLMGEIFPTAVLGTASSIGTAVNWGTSFFVTLTFEGLQDALGRDVVFFCYGLVCFGCFVFVRSALPETRNRTVNEVLSDLMEAGGAVRSLASSMHEPAFAGVALGNPWPLAQPRKRSGVPAPPCRGRRLRQSTASAYAPHNALQARLGQRPEIQAACPSRRLRRCRAAPPRRKAILRRRRSRRPEA
eukprot:CAMPEP_0170233678 /NCGR_PEP_ID=MMETSP0116_2-20130129/16585_1 /TAXON_ID=400756 /ORGANISM="Durinskia baltica, Strain CSIRO CS-38" /LENGTH=602 /DNA_ID=CAMNT_0010484473 /DNA_START=21 /DNA_END=1828 /DNA_ORIENTATION=-